MEVGSTPSPFVPLPTFMRARCPFCPGDGGWLRKPASGDSRWLRHPRSQKCACGSRAYKVGAKSPAMGRQGDNTVSNLTHLLIVSSS
eukprot:6173396-Pleurochrysis_carterae.AAC.3